MNIKKSPIYLKRTFVTALMLLFFIGQTLAFSDSCVMEDSDQSVDVLMSIDASHDMADHEMGSDSMHSDQGDCCNQNCKCPEGVCSGVSVILAEQSDIEILVSSSELKSTHNFYINNSINNLYRPPINC
ncbi:MAG: hypothetical protein L3J52_00365 [Proteobacteria bacterium]|nr:hypothetical protein [Pseudomonadota bacterium]